MTYTDMMNLSMNQVLMRSLNTTIISILPVISLLVVGAVHPRRGHPRGVRRRPARRPGRRRLLVDLRRRPGRRVAQGARAPQPSPCRERLGQVHRGVDRRRRRGRPTADGTGRSPPGGRGDARRRAPPARRTSTRPNHPPRPRKKTKKSAARHRAARSPRGPAPRRARRSTGAGARGRDRSCLDHIRDIPDLPQPGVMFKDITPLLADAGAFRFTVDALAEHFAGRRDRPGGRHRGPGLHLRRAGRLPLRRRLRAGAQGGQAAVGDRARGVRARVRHRPARDPPRRASRPGERVLIVDDVLATGGTAAATARLVERLGGDGRRASRS